MVDVDLELDHEGTLTGPRSPGTGRNLAHEPPCLF
jgi:hypothetical protein